MAANRLKYLVRTFDNENTFDLNPQFIDGIGLGDKLYFTIENQEFLLISKDMSKLVDLFIEHIKSRFKLNKVVYNKDNIINLFAYLLDKNNKLTLKDFIANFDRISINYCKDKAQERKDLSPLIYNFVMSDFLAFKYNLDNQKTIDTEDFLLSLVILDWAYREEAV